MPMFIYLLLPVLCIASWIDFRERRIPNSLLLPSFLLALVLNIVISGSAGLLHSLAGAFMGFVLLIIPHVLGGMGAGDVKLLMVIGSFGGIYFVLYSFLAGAIIGGILALTMLIIDKKSQKRLSSIPYGIPLSLGVVVYVISKHWGVWG